VDPRRRRTVEELMSTHVVTERGRVVGIVTVMDVLELLGR
jgi:predicted transcriptional regulator